MADQEFLEKMKRLQETGRLDEAIDNAQRRAAERTGEFSPQVGEGKGTLREGLAKGAQMAVPFGNWRERTEQARAAGSPINEFQKGATGAFQGIMMGAIPTLNAAGEEIGARIAGTDDKTFNQRRQEIGELMNEEAGLIGEVGGALTGGPRVLARGLQEGIEATPALARYMLGKGTTSLAARTGFTGAIGAGETFAYSTLSGADLGEAGYDAMLGALGGGAAQPMSELIGGIVNVFKPLVGKGTQKEVAENIVEVIKQKMGEEFVETAFGREQLNVDAIARMMRNTGAEDASLATLAPNAFPKTIRALSTDQNLEVSSVVNKLVASMVNARKASLPQFRGAVAETLMSANVRSSQALINQGQATRQALQPRYDEAFAAATRAGGGKAKGVKVRDLRQAISKQFPNAHKLTSERDIRDRLLAELPDDYTNYGRNKRLTELTPRQLLLLRQSFDDAIYSQKFAGTGALTDASIKRSMLPKVSAARAVLKDRLYQVAPGIKQVDEEFSDEVLLRHAYEAGADAFKDNKGGNTAKYEAFMLATDRSPAQLSSFLEGVKSELVRNINKKSSPTALENYVGNNPEKFDLVEAVAGKETRQALEQQIERYITVQSATKGVDDAAPNIYNKRKDLMGMIADLGLGAGALIPNGPVSSSLGLGALRRQAATGLNAGGVGDVATAKSLAAALEPNALVGARAVNEELMKNLPTLFRGLPAFAPAGSAGED
jgi:hypothetical protein